MGSGGRRLSFAGAVLGGLMTPDFAIASGIPAVTIVTVE
jgi:hypothetical protein